MASGIVSKTFLQQTQLCHSVSPPFLVNIFSHLTLQGATHSTVTYPLAQRSRHTQRQHRILLKLCSPLPVSRRSRLRAANLTICEYQQQPCMLLSFIVTCLCSEPLICRSGFRGRPEGIGFYKNEMRLNSTMVRFWKLSRSQLAN